jgi:hypothetical protein
LGIAAGDDRRQVQIRFAGAPVDPSVLGKVRERWMVDAALTLRRSALLGATTATVTTGEQGGQLIVETTAAAASADAPAVVRAVILSVRPGSIADREAEVVTVPDTELAAWRRDSQPISAAPGDPFGGVVSDSDARWLWVIALLLLGAEAWVRRSRAGARMTEVRDAA